MRNAPRRRERRHGVGASLEMARAQSGGVPAPTNGSDTRNASLAARPCSSRGGISTRPTSAPTSTLSAIWSAPPSSAPGSGSAPSPAPPRSPARAGPSRRGDPHPLREPRVAPLSPGAEAPPRRRPLGLLTLKPNSRTSSAFRFRALRGQLGYKLPALLRRRAPSVQRQRDEGGALVLEVLLGDDAEADAFVYSLFGDICSGAPCLPADLAEIRQRGRRLR